MALFRNFWSTRLGRINLQNCLCDAQLSTPPRSSLISFDISKNYSFLDWKQF